MPTTWTARLSCIYLYNIYIYYIIYTYIILYYIYTYMYIYLTHYKNTMSVFFLCTGLQGKNIYTSIKLLSAQRKKERKKEGKKREKKG